MKSVQAFPYLRPKRARVRTDAWRLDEVGERVPLPDALPHWDPSTGIRVVRSVTIDVPGLRDDCQLAASGAVRVVAVWRSEGTALRGRGEHHDLRLDGGTVPLALVAQLEGAQLASSVTIETHVVLLDGSGSRSRFSPRRPGSILWSDRHAVLLEGTATRFPTELVDFEKSGWLPSGGAWFLEWNPDDLHEPMLRGTRLYLNSARKAVATAVTAARPDDAGRAVLEMIRFDVARTMIVGALDNEEFTRAPRSFEEDTVGAAMRRLLAALFPGEEPAQLLERRRQTRGGFDCEIQAKLRLLREV